MTYIISVVFLIVLFLVTLQYNSKEKYTMAYNPTTVANYFIKNYKSGDMTPMKVIKLTYLSYCWYLALTKSERLLNEKAVAWDFGPVFPSLYQSLKDYGKTEIRKEIPTHTEEKIDEETKVFLNKIWSMYGKFDGVYLSALTHQMETPWQKVYCKGCNSEINDEDIIEHYSEKLISA